MIGAGFVSDEEAKRRLDICTRCPRLTKEYICTLCGCHMESKTQVEYSTCPENRW